MDVWEASTFESQTIFVCVLNIGREAFFKDAHLHKSHYLFATLNFRVSGENHEFKRTQNKIILMCVL